MITGRIPHMDRNAVVVIVGSSGTHTLSTSRSRGRTCAAESHAQPARVRITLVKHMLREGYGAHPRTVQLCGPVAY
eukprot:CAMPEP_0181169812 /NCGR_PEP_ID=MMETSP1096-20121128/1018_1 /TAXON_ID=156174 ORGANISM="Chrysochromulina ericina, Strain CCMP281" /NCGR_SAMPLE_ID=MMETSP1096 /ASSEMBLY_ACC=CAM_ASM_000453 /LENGTH=75 /DNA_ID=CAMNT_0023257303 /DNA_START=46 /DNA_END=273 /DNA_ORIENTATION=-